MEYVWYNGKTDRLVIVIADYPWLLAGSKHWICIGEL